MAFPPGFLFGTANADHQVEAHDPACEDVWDLWERGQGLTPRGRATDFWHRYPEDIAAAASIGCKLFRFSVSWSRVETSEGHFDPSALDHYRQLATTIRHHGMKVMLTLHHFVWPAWLERDHGGMIGERFPEFFTRYAQTLASHLGDLVDFWITFNEPSQLTFGYIKPWWQNRYYMPPGLPAGSHVDDEAEAVGRLVPSLFLAHSRARDAIRTLHPNAKVGVNPLVTGFPSWLQSLMDFGACHRRLSEALFKFTTSGALIREHGEVDLVIGGITADDQTRFLFSDPYVRTGKAILVRSNQPDTPLDSLTGQSIGVIAVGNQPDSWKRDLPSGIKKRIFRNYDEARTSLASGEISAIYGDAFFLLPEGMIGAECFRFLSCGLSDETYVVAAPHGHADLMLLVNRAIARLRQESSDSFAASWQSHSGSIPEDPRRPLSLSEMLENDDSHPVPTFHSRRLRHIRRRERLRVALRTDTPGVSELTANEGLELKLARRIAREILGDESKLEIIPVEPAQRLTVLDSKTGWLNWAWRFWGTTSLIANANWWYLGMAGKLPSQLCPPEAIGSLDFIGLDYYWGLPTHRLRAFRTLEDAAHGRFLQAPVWPRGLYHALRRFHRWFPQLPLYIVENGSVPEADHTDRSTYLRLHLDQVKQALAEGIPVIGYNVWSITSNREWGHPFDRNTDFGLYFIDLDKDPRLVRHPTSEVSFYRQFISEQTEDKVT